MIVWFFRYILFDRAKILHVHNELPFCYLFFLLHRIFKKQLVFTIHDQMNLVKVINSKNGEYYFLKLLIKNKMIKWIAVNETISKQLILLGVDASNVEVIPAYLPANETGFELSSELKQYFESHTPNMFFYAFGIKQLNGLDLYGLDMALESIKYLKEDYPKIGLFLLVPDADKDPNIGKYLDFVSEHKLQYNIKFHFEVIPDLNVICDKSEIYLRPTCSDGDSLTVREALHKNIKVLVSDVVERPANCILFKNRDVLDMVRVLNETIQSLDKGKEVKPEESVDFLNKILKIYSGFNKLTQAS
jgi:glycosyltransferase involved in cell wall biosynthesis